MKQLQEIYKVGNKKYLYDPDSLKYCFNIYKNYTDEEFLENISSVLHYAVYVCWVKEIPTDECLADDGIIHELVHLLSENTAKYTDLKKVRKKFNKSLIM